LDFPNADGTGAAEGMFDLEALDPEFTITMFILTIRIEGMTTLYKYTLYKYFILNTPSCNSRLVAENASF